MISFGNTRQFLQSQHDQKERFKSFLAHSLCLQTIVETDKSEEVSQIVDMVDSLKAVNEKHLLIKVFNDLKTITLLANKSINFNVYIVHEVTNGGNVVFG